MFAQIYLLVSQKNYFSFLIKSTVQHQSTRKLNISPYETTSVVTIKLYVYGMGHSKKKAVKLNKSRGGCSFGGKQIVLKILAILRQKLCVTVR